MIDPKDAVTADEWLELQKYLSIRYDGIMNAEAIESHIRDYVGFTFPDNVVGMVLQTAPQNARLLDIGCGFGGWVLRARDFGIDASGVEIAETEVVFAKRRLRRLRPQDDPDAVYQCADARTLPLAPHSVDIVTAWNVLEHVQDYQGILSYAYQILKPGGVLYIICPNYAAFREEAHYHVPWYPWFPRAMAARYLQRKERNPSYFDNEIFYTTNLGVQAKLRKLGFSLYSLDNRILMKLSLSTLTRNIKMLLDFYNPFRKNVLIAARKSQVK